MTDMNDEAGKGKVDWTAPLEAVHESGRVVPVTVKQTGIHYVSIMEALPNFGCASSRYFSPDGSHANEQWRIRNVTPTDPRPALYDRMEKLVRDMTIGYPTYAMTTLASGWVSEARAIVAELPKPVDPDEAIANGLVGPFDIWGNATAHAEAQRLALAAIKRGRELEQGK